MKYSHSNRIITMMTMKNTLKIVSFMALSLIYTNANALGIGLYATLTNSGDADWEHSTDNSTVNRDLDQKEIGFVLDTAIATNRLFNYRLQVAVVDASYDNIEMDGIVLTNTFGFGVVRNSNLRFWIGPQVGFKYLESNDDTDMELVTFDLGAATGLNYHIGSTVSLTAEAGYKLGYGVADIGSTASSNEDDFDYEISENRLFVNVGLLFRFGRDKY